MSYFLYFDLFISLDCLTGASVKREVSSGDLQQTKSQKDEAFSNQEQGWYNTCVIELPSDQQISLTFNVADIFEYHPPYAALTVAANSETSFTEVG